MAKMPTPLRELRLHLFAASRAADKLAEPGVDLVIGEVRDSLKRALSWTEELTEEVMGEKDDG